MDTRNIKSQNQHFSDNSHSIENHYANVNLNNNTNHPNIFQIHSNESEPFKIYNPNSENYQTYQNRGRVDGLEDRQNSYPRYDMFQEGSDQSEENFYDSLKGIMESSIVAKVFFSGRNIDNLQGKIVQGVFNRSGGNIRVGRQSDSELKIIMRSVFLQKGNNVDCRIQDQIRFLNKEVLDYCVSNVLTGAVGHVNYIRDISRPVGVSPLPENVNMKGVNNALQPNHFI